MCAVCRTVGDVTVCVWCTGLSVTGQVPGSMYTALLDSGVIQNPLYRDNDVKLAWIGHENWTYTRYFEGDMIHNNSMQV